MTRDAEHTPTGYEDAASVVVNQAPAPSSLAGGEVSRAVACVGQIANGAQVAEVYGGEWCIDPALECRAHLRAILAALSPEAPAREGEGGPPREPTQTMMDALLYHSSHDTKWEDAYTMWTAAHDTWFRDGPDASALTPRHEVPQHGGLQPGDEVEFRDHPTEPGREVAHITRHEAPASPSDAIEHPLYTVSEAARRQLVRAASWIEKEAYDASGNDDPEDEGLDEAAAWLRSTFDLSDTALGIERNASDEIASIGHEAPAALCDHGHTDPMALCSDCEAASVEAPAEGAGEALDRLAALCDGNNLGPIGMNSLRSVLAALRARSSAPEAREGEAVDDRLHSAIKKLKAHVAAIQAGKRNLSNVIDGPNPILSCVNELPAIIRQLDVAELEIEAAFERYEDHPAAPSADKLRIAVEALEPFAAFARVAEAKSRLALGKVLPDNEIIASTSWEGGLGVLVMGHLRDALTLVPDAKGWGGIYRRSEDLAALKAEGA